MTAHFVAKFGGSTFPEATGYRRIAEYLLDQVRATGRRAAVIVSAMSGETEGLRSRLHQVNPRASYQGSAALLTLADVISAYLLREAVVRAGGTATALTQYRHGITTDRVWMSAGIENLDPRPVMGALQTNDIVVIPGGPASDGSGNPTWMGKNSSDLTAVATAVNIGTPEVSVHSDVPGVYSADPNLLPEAELLPRVSYRAASLMSARGAKVIHQRSVDLASLHGITIRCRSNRAPFDSGTVIEAVAPGIHAVVIDLKSILVEFDDPDTARSAELELIRQSVPTVWLAGQDRPVLAVPGGNVDVARHFDEAGIKFRPTTGRLVSEIHGATVTGHLAHDDEQAVALGRRLHGRHLPQRPLMTAHRFSPKELS